MERISKGKTEVQYDYSCSMVRIEPITKGIINKYIFDNISKEDLYLGEPNENIEYGYELDSHITIIYGYKTNNIEKIANSFSKYTKDSINVTLGKINYFEHKLYYVLYISVSGQDVFDLQEYSLNSGLSIDILYPDYKPHCTLAYIKRDSWKKYEYLVNDEYFDKMNIVCKQIKITSANGNSDIYTLN